MTFRTLFKSGAGSFSLEITCLHSWKGKVIQLSLNSCLGVGYSLDLFFFLSFFFFFGPEMGNTLEISWIGQRLKESRVLGFLDRCSTSDWQGHAVYLIKMSLGQAVRGYTQHNSIGSFVFQHWNAGLQPSKGCKQIWANTDNATTFLPSRKKAAAQWTLQSLLFILQICENVHLPSLLNTDM